MQENNSGVFF